MKQNLPRILQKIAASRFFAVSLVLHLLLLFLVGGVVMFASAKLPKGFEVSDLSILEQEETQSVPDEVPAQEFEEEAAVETQKINSISQASVISSLAQPSSTQWQTNSAPSPLRTGNIVGLSEQGITQSGAGQPGVSNSMGKSQGGRMVGTLFGRKIESKKLGVILDISGSTREVLQLPLEQIQKQFAGAVILLYPGCGMESDVPRDDYPVRRWKSIKEDEKARPKFRSTIGQLLNTAKTNPALTKMLKAENISIVDHRVDETLCVGAQFAFAELERQGVDTIYWFADFRDPLEDKVIDAVAGSLKQKKIKVICHNFAGVFRNEKLEDAVRKFARKTDGEVLMVVPK